MSFSLSRHFGRLAALAFSLLLPAAGPLRAHDILLLPAADGARLTIKYGHPGDYTLPDKEKLFALDAYPAGGGAPFSLLDEVKPAGPDTLTLPLDRTRLGATGGVSLIGARFDNGYFVEIDKEHYYNTSKRELPQAKKSGHYLKFAKALLAPSPNASRAGFERALGYRLEIIPQADPFLCKVGDELSVRVLFDGQPLAGAEVDVISGEFPMQKGMELPKVKTDASGLAKVKLERPGWQSIGTDHTLPSADPQLADEDNYASTVSFLLPAR